MANRALGRELPEDCIAAGWQLMHVTSVPLSKVPPSIQRRSNPPPTFRAVAFCESVPALPWVRDWGRTEDESIANLAARLRRHWITEDGHAGIV